MGIRIRESSGRWKRCCSRAKACHTIRLRESWASRRIRFANTCESTETGALNGEKEIRFRHPRSELDAHRESLSSLFRGASACHGERSGGQDRRTHRYPAWSDSGSAVLGLARLTSAKGRHDPRQGGRATASAFQKKELEPRLEQATGGKRIVYFVDAAHFVLAPFWVICGRGCVGSFERLRAGSVLMSWERSMQ